MDRTQFTFYESFAKAIQRIKKPAERCQAYDAIVNYALYGIEPDDTKVPDIVSMAFELVKPNLDASRRKAENGKKGGSSEAKPKQTESKPKAKSKQGETSSKKENEKENEKEGEKEKENECYISPLSPLTGKETVPDLETMFGYNEFLLDTVKDWLTYKKQKKQGYHDMGLKSLLTTIQNRVAEYGEEAVITVIRDSMAANYQGITWDKLKLQNKKQYTSNNSYSFMDVLRREEQNEQNGNSEAFSPFTI